MHTAPPGASRRVYKCAPTQRISLIVSTPALCENLLRSRGMLAAGGLLSHYSICADSSGPGMQMNVLMFMLAGSDTSRDAHKVLLGILPQLPPAIMEEVGQHASCICQL